MAVFSVLRRCHVIVNTVTMTTKISLPRNVNVIMSFGFAARSFSSIPLTKNIELITNDKKNSQISNLKVQNPQEKPLVVLLSWLMAKRKHIHKYANIYLDHGFDVLNISVSPWQLLWPAKGTQVVAQDILKFLHTNDKYSPLVLHGFSVGAYLWSEVLVQIARETDRYQHIVDRVAGQIWDSAADITEISIGMPIAVFPRNTVMQNALKQYILYHMKTFDKVATCHYVRASQMFHTNIIKAPALIFLSKADPVGAERSNLRAKESWENMGIEVVWKCFEKSPHVGHLRHHPEEYVGELNNFLLKVGASYPERIKAKL